MDRKSITRFRKSLEARQRELRVGVAKTQKEMLTAQHDYGKDEGDRANTSLAKEMQRRTLHLSDESEAVLQKPNLRVRCQVLREIA